MHANVIIKWIIIVVNQKPFCYLNAKDCYRFCFGFIASLIINYELAGMNPVLYHCTIYFILSETASKPTKSNFVSDNTLLTIANFTLNDEAGRVEKLDGIETKFYCLKKYEVIASVSVFSIEVFKGKFEVFSFILILPYSEMSEFLPRHSICESKLQRLLKEYLIIPLREMVSIVHYWINYVVMVKSTKYSFIHAAMY